MAGRSRGFMAADDEEQARLAVNSILPPDDDAGDNQYIDYQMTNVKDGTLSAESSEIKTDFISEDDDKYQHHNMRNSHEGVHYENESKDIGQPRFYQDSNSGKTPPKLENMPASDDKETSVEAPKLQQDSAEKETLCDVVAAHYNNVPETGLDERSRSRILHLRNFNNWIKSMLIDEFVTKVRESRPRGSSLKVLDMGCGKGGDLFKWRQGKITHLVCTDIAATSVQQCKERYYDVRQRAQRERNVAPLFSAEFIVANCTKERLREQYTDVTMQLDLVSCQFAFHYCFESLPQAECMMRNAAECLRPGGYFFGTCPNANAIVSRARKAGGKKFGNEVYSVEFETPIDDDVPPPIFGAKYDFHMEGVVDCPEFLVHFPTFIRLASRFGLEFVVCEPFQSFFERMKESGRGLLGKMQALETYPPFPDQTLMGSLEQYQHADTFLKENGAVRVGTLSADEWEATTLYLIFVFKKASS